MYCSFATQLCRTYTSTFQGYRQFDLIYKGSNDKKTKTAVPLFTAAGLSAPPQPIWTPWGTWLEASFFYPENFQIVKQIVSSFEDGGKLVEQAKETIADQEVFS